MTIPKTLNVSGSGPIVGAGSAADIFSVDWSSFASKQEAISFRNDALKTLPPLSRKLVQGREAKMRPYVLQLQAAMQKRLDAMGGGYTVPQTGVWDDDMDNAVGFLQAKAGITVDHKVGNQTWSVILGTPPDLRAEPGYLRTGVALLGTLSEKDLEELQGFERTIGLSRYDGRSRDFTSLSSGGLRTNALTDWAAEEMSKRGLHPSSTTGGDHAEHSYHYQGLAMDIVGGTTETREQFRKDFEAKAADLNIPLHEVIHQGYFRKEGQMVAGISNHDTHLHVSWYDTGPNSGIKA